MKILFRYMASRVLVLLTALTLTLAAGGAQAQPAYTFSQAELDQMLAPVALYPDALLAQVLMAATYPLELQEAARWSRDRANLSGDEAVREAEYENWDASVSSLVAFPQLLARMAENPQWTQALGDAFLEQQPQVMDTVQALRRRAQAAGNLRSDERMSVLESGPNLLLQAYDPERVYVPYYDPTAVYGSWWWPAYQPVYLRPWHGYYARPAYAGGFYWGAPVAISTGFFFGAIDWRQRQARVGRDGGNYYNRLNDGRQSNPSGAWRHDPDHRRGIAYRSGDAQRRFGAVGVAPVRGNRAWTTEGRPETRTEVRPPETRPDARIDFRRPESHTRIQTQAVAPAAPASVLDIRIEGRRPDAQAVARTGAQPAGLAPAANASRIEIRQEARASAGAAPALPASSTTTEPRRGPGPGPAHFGDARVRAEGHANAQPLPPQPGLHIDATRAPQARVENHAAPGPARPETAISAVPRHGRGERPQAPQAAPARTEPPAPAAAPRQADARGAARGKAAQ
jgi:hypothetical protein